MKPEIVCLVAKYTYPQDTRLSQQVNVLANNGIRVHVVCLKGEGQLAYEEIGTVALHRIMQKKPKEGFVRYLSSTLGFGLKSFRTLCLLSNKNNCQVIVVHTLPEFLVFTGVFHKVLGSKLILDGRDITYELLSSRWRGMVVAPIKMVARLVESMCIAICCEVITASNGFKRSLVKRGISDKKITVLFNTADTSIFKYDVLQKIVAIESGARLIYHGTVSERFGILVAVEAMVSVVSAIPKSTFHVYGVYDPLYKAILEKRIETLGLAKSVFLNEVKPLDEIANIMYTMDLGIVPYLSDSFMNLALSTKTFEYVAAGLPVVASRLASTEELFDVNCLFYANPGDSKKLAETIIAALGNPQERMVRREKAYTTFQGFSGEVIGNTYLALIKKHLRG